jgi:predicted MFS family arabinose efflux permease
MRSVSPHTPFVLLRTGARHSVVTLSAGRPDSEKLPRIFWAFWVAGLASNLGTWMQLVGSAWLMTSLTASAALVALLQTATSVPAFLLSLPAGALADVVDRRRLIIVTQLWQLLTAAVLGILTIAGITTPTILLVATFVLATGATLGLPVMGAIVPELVDRDQLPRAVALGSTSFTLAQAIGPAIGGILVATAGSEFVFLLNAVSFAAVVVVAQRWRRDPPVATLPAEHVLGAMRAGARYVTHAPALDTVLIRAGAYIACFSALPALLAVIAREQLGASASQYGVLLGALGVGGVAGTLLLPRLRRRSAPDRLVVPATLVYGGTLAGLGALDAFAAALPLMLVMGLANMTVMSSLNIAAQSVLPGWVRGRGLAVYQLVFAVCIAIGAALWGTLAASSGTDTALMVAGGALVIVAALAAPFPLSATEGIDVTPAHHTEPHVGDVALDPSDGPVVVTVEYEVEPEHIPEFVSAMRELRRVRRRDGALHWTLSQDVEEPLRHVESYLVASWAEHERQLERTTQSDEALFARVAAVHTGEEPLVRHLLGHHFRRERHAPRRHLGRPS